MSRNIPPALAFAASLLALAGAAHSQTMNANSAAYNAGYGRTADEENQPVNVQLTDANGNLTVVNGLVENSASGSVFNQSSGQASASVSGAGDTFTGAGGTASAVGNSLDVVVQGSNNTVIVNSAQTNTGAVTATTSLGGAQ